MKNTKGDRCGKSRFFASNVEKQAKYSQKTPKPLSKRQKPLLSYNQYYVK